MRKKYNYFRDLRPTFKIYDQAFIKRVLKFGIPMGISSIIMSLMSIVDKLFIGQASTIDGPVGDYALGATFIASWYYSIVIMSISGFIAMSGVVATQYFGAKKYNQSQQAMRLSIIFGLIISLIGVISAQVFPHQIASLLANTRGTTLAAEANHKYGINYLRIMSISSIFFVISSHINRLYAWNEKTKIVLLATLSGLIFNAFFNYLFMFALGWGVIGCAWSTVVVELLMIIMLFSYLATRKNYQGLFNPLININNLSKKITKEVFSKGLMLLNQIAFTSMMTLGQVFIARTYNDGPTIQGIMAPFSNFFLIAMSGILSTTSTIVGKDLGRKDYQKAYANSIRITIYGIIVALLGATLFIAFSPFLPLIFSAGRNNHNIAQQAMYVIMIASLTYILWIWAQGYGIALMVGGKSWMFTIVSSGSAFLDLIFAVMILLIDPGFDYWIAFLLWKSTRIVRVMFSYYFYRQQSWIQSLVKDTKVEEQEEKLKI